MIEMQSDRLVKALREVAKVTRRDMAEIVSRALLNVAYRASSFSPMTTVGKIEADLTRNGVLDRIAVASLKKRQGKFTRAELKAEKQRIKRIRKSRVKALRASWSKTITDMGGRFRGARTKPQSTIRRGFGRRANQYTLIARGRNALKTSSSKGVTDASQIPGLVRALSLAEEYVAATEEIYAFKKIDAQLRKHSDR